MSEITVGKTSPIRISHWNHIGVHFLVDAGDSWGRLESVGDCDRFIKAMNQDRLFRFSESPKTIDFEQCSLNKGEKEYVEEYILRCLESVEKKEAKEVNLEDQLRAATLANALTGKVQKITLPDGSVVEVG